MTNCLGDKLWLDRLYVVFGGTMSRSSPTHLDEAFVRADIGWAWFVRRTILAVLILFVGISGIAWVLHASIDQNLEAQAAAQPVLEQSATLTGSISR